MNGLLIVNKEKGMTSFSCANKARRLLKEKKAGHTGTLDPMAEGVLPVLLGTYTKLAPLIVEREKEYIAGGRFGLSTDTLDITGNIIEKTELSGNETDARTLREILESFAGETEQIPPMYSAIKVDGKKLYELARSGIEIERKPRKITIHEIELISFSFPDFKIRCRCSKGTYIRTLIDDIGKKAGIPCVMTELLRTETGGFRIEESVRLSDIETEGRDYTLKTIKDIFKDMPEVHEEERFIKLLLNGVSVKDRDALKNIEHEGLILVSGENDCIIGIAEFKNEELKLKYRI